MENLKLKLIISLSTCFILFNVASSTPQLHRGSDGREYLIETELTRNWYQAGHECSRRDFQLVVIDSANKNNVIIALLKNIIGKSRNLWLGGNDEYNLSRDKSRPFFWSATGEKFSFTFWSDNNPDNYRNDEHCVHIWEKEPLYKWNDVGCSHKMGFICEKNHHLEIYQKDLTNKCNAVKESISSISTEFIKIQEKQLFDSNFIIRNISRVADNWKAEMQQLQKATQVSIKRILDEQQDTVTKMTDEMLKEVNNLNSELIYTNAAINKKFAENLNANQTEIIRSC